MTTNILNPDVPNQFEFEDSPNTAAYPLTRVCCLYRVSTDKQVDYNDKHQADIPMQRKECHEFARRMGWTVVYEYQEEGVSGHKVHAKDRHELQKIIKLAQAHEFDVLLVYMFDRLGRIAAETPFVIKELFNLGIRIWSTQEGEQRFESNIDDLINFLRYWAAEGESLKTSMRTKSALGQLAQEGGYTGGTPAYGYDAVPSGHLNKRKHEVGKLVINEGEAAVVRMIYDKCAYEGFGDQRIATFLASQGHYSRSGKQFHPSTIRHILINPLYTGIIRSGDSRSPIQEHLQIISSEQFDLVQAIRVERSKAAADTPHIPLNTRGEHLLSGIVFCGHCGSRLGLTTNGKHYPCKEDPNRVVKRVRYVCYGKTRKQTDCNGQTGYTAHILDGIVDKFVRQIFARTQSIPKSEVVAKHHTEKLASTIALLEKAKKEHDQALKTLESLQEEVIKSLQGESSYEPQTLNSIIKAQEAKCDRLRQRQECDQAEYNKGQALLTSINAQYDELLSWADLYNDANIATKKMIVGRLIKRVDVYRGYDLHIELNLDYKQFVNGLTLPEHIA